MNVSHEMHSNLNISPNMSHSVLECDSVMLQNYLIMIFNNRFCNEKGALFVLIPVSILYKHKSFSNNKLE